MTVIFVGQKLVSAKILPKANGRILDIMILWRHTFCIENARKFVFV